MQERFRALPSVDRIVAEALAQMVDKLPRALLTTLAREVLGRARASLPAAERPPGLRELALQVVEAGRTESEPSLRPVINATGVIIHTNLGRAPLSDEARAAMGRITLGYSNLEFELDAGERGSRYDHLEQLLRRVTGAEAGIAVNNNASALLLALSALAVDREVVISRSQAVEIGGGFRIPDVMLQSGARVVEVGTTNRTYLADFERAVGFETAAFLRVHASNFRIRGFTAFPPLADLTAAARRHGILVLDDLGSGCLMPVEPFGLAHEPTVQESVAAGADLSLFSGDKLLGGPQAGIIVGRNDLVQRLRAHPLARVVRMDKASIAALAATLHHYLRGEAVEKIPVWRMIAATPAELHGRASAWASALGAVAAVTETRSMVGGGSLPDESLPTSVLAVSSPSAAALAGRLRRGSPPIIARVEQNRVLLDPRTVDPREDASVIATLHKALSPSRRRAKPPTAGA